MENAKYRIGEFSKLVGISPKTLRYYDEIGLFKPEKIDVFTNYRYYTFNQIKDVKLILELKEVGFTLVEIRDNWNKWNDRIIFEQKEKIYRDLDLLNSQLEKLNDIGLRIENGLIDD